MKEEALRWVGWLVLSISIAFSPSFLWAGEVDILVRKLVEKGILTREDAEGILREIREEAAQRKKKAPEERKAAEEGKKKEAQAAEAAGGPRELPEWVKNTKFGGDLRLRYQAQERKDDPAKENRARFRLRAEAEAKVMDDLTVGLGIVSGSDDPRSGTETFENTFSKKNVRINTAFAEYAPASWVTLTGGKFSNPLYRPADLVWDGDITPEGAAVGLRSRLRPDLDLFLNAGAFILDERGGAKDPYLAAIQPGLAWQITPDARLQLALAYCYFGRVRGSALDFSSGTNTTAGGRLVFDYHAPVLSGELAFKNPLGLALIPSFALFGEAVYNPDPDRENRGYLAGFRVGHPEMKRFGDWRLEYSYRRLEKDAWPDILPDSDFYGGSTNVKGMEFIFSLAFGEKIWLAIDYYRTRRILGLKQRESIFQADLNLKF